MQSSTYIVSSIKRSSAIFLWSIRFNSELRVLTWKMLRRRKEGPINNGFGPIYEQRGSRSTTACVIVLILFSLCMVINYFLVRTHESSSPWYFNVFAFGVSFLVPVLGEMTKRLFLFAEECRHVDSRYDGSWKKAFRAVFEFRNKKLIGFLTFVAAGLIALAYIWGGLEWNVITPNDRCVWFFLSVFIGAAVHFVGLSAPSKVELSQISEEQNKNLADGLAWSYYYGYLKFVLPNLDAQINLVSLRHKIPRKLFILLPKNCKVDDIISDRDLVKDVMNLEPLEVNRGGIRQRTYQHTVYQIKDERSGQEHYCLMEYATPLRTLSKMSDPSSNAGLSREERDYQVVAFYSKIKEILDGDESFKGKYELVTISGDNDKLGEIMINALDKQTAQHM